MTATSDPYFATVEVFALRTNETFSRVIPATFTLDKGSDFRLTFELAGYRSEEIVVRREVNDWFFASMRLPAGTDSMGDHTMTIAHIEFLRSTAQNRAPGAIVTVGLTDESGHATWSNVPIVLQRI